MLDLFDHTAAAHCPEVDAISLHGNDDSATVLAVERLGTSEKG